MKGLAGIDDMIIVVAKVFVEGQTSFRLGATASHRFAWDHIAYSSRQREALSTAWERPAWEISIFPCMRRASSMEEKNKKKK